MLNATHRSRVRARLAALLAVVLALGGLVTFATPAAAADPCTTSGTGDWASVTCQNKGEGGGVDIENVGNTGPRVCREIITGATIPCENEHGTFSDGAYCRVADPQPDPSSPIWAEHGGGVVLRCVYPGGPTTLRWSPNPEFAVAVSPVQVAHEVAVGMHLSTGTIGTAPPTAAQNPDSKGLVARSIWLWIEPGENTTGPLTRTSSEYGITVTATARLHHVDWQLRSSKPHSGSPVFASTTCTGTDAPGTPYARHLMPADGTDRNSPTCGFTANQNTRSGTFIITARATWTIAWTGAGEQGTFTITTTPQTATLTLSEAQALIDH